MANGNARKTRERNCWRGILIDPYAEVAGGEAQHLAECRRKLVSAVRGTAGDRCASQRGATAARGFLLCAFCGNGVGIPQNILRVFVVSRESNRLPVFRRGENSLTFGVEACDTCPPLHSQCGTSRKMATRFLLVDDLAAIPLALWADEYGYPADSGVNLLGT